MIRDGKFYIDHIQAYEFGVRPTIIHGKWEHWIATGRGYGFFVSDPFDSPEDALANLLTVLNEG